MARVRRSGSIVTTAAALLAAGCTSSDSDTSGRVTDVQETTKATDSRCIVPPAQLIDSIGAQLRSRAATLRWARAVKTLDASVGGYFISAEVEGPGELGGKDDVGTWYVYDLRDVEPNEIFSMTGFERSVSDWPLSSAEELTMGVDGASESRACVADASR